MSDDNPCPVTPGALVRHMDRLGEVLRRRENDFGTLVSPHSVVVRCLYSGLWKKYGRPDNKKTEVWPVNECTVLRGAAAAAARQAPEEFITKLLRSEMVRRPPRRKP